jgi:Ca-activated chloride channel family protein
MRIINKHKNKHRNKHKLLALVLSALAIQAHADTSWSTNWSNLWRNADQRGAALLQQGDPAGAAKTYTDPRAKSYAEFKAGNYAAAAQDLAPFSDSDANYNRGNALAYAGNLQEALNAYDAALKRDPNNRDAHHNRDLVANALKQQQQQKQPPKQDQKQDQKQGAQNSPQSGQQPKNAQSGDQQNQGQSGNPSQKNDGTSGANPAASTAKNASNKPGATQTPPSTPAQPSAGSSAQSGPAKQTGQAGQTGQTGQHSDADQAKRDVAAGMKNGAPLTPGDTDGNGLGAPPASAPQSETQIAQDQWLRSIPDDPGGLLRRKFLIEHMIRQQSAQP